MVTRTLFSAHSLNVFLQTLYEVFDVNTKIKGEVLWRAMEVRAELDHTKRECLTQRMLCNSSPERNCHTANP